MRTIEMKSAAAKPGRETKSIRVEIKDAEKGIVAATFATTGVKDHDDDYTLPGAFESGAPCAISAYGHRSWMGGKPVGKGAIREEGNKAILDGQFFLSTIDGKDTFTVIKEMGPLQEWSYGFDVLETGEVTEQLRQMGVRRVIKKVRVYEVSPVLLGAGIDTETLATKERQTDPSTEPEPSPELQADARRELAKFMKTQARLRGQAPEAKVG